MCHSEITVSELARGVKTLIILLEKDESTFSSQRPALGVALTFLKHDAEQVWMCFYLKAVAYLFDSK